jgi:hypothetical protein
MGNSTAALPQPDPSQRLRQRTKLRIAILLLMLSGVSLYASAIVTRHKLRAQWRETLQVAVILLGPGGVGREKLTMVKERLPKLDAMMAREFTRYHPGQSFAPVHFELVGAVGVEKPPPMPPDSGTYVDRALHAWRLSRYLADVNKRGQLKLGGYADRIYVMVEPARNTQARFVEGVGAKDGDVGLVSTQLDESTLDLTLLAVGHEFLHCVGATDKYDANGHTDMSVDLPEPDRVPIYPQRFAEIMVGEITTGPGDGRLPDTLDQVAVGPLTAHEVGWLKDGQPAPAVASRQLDGARQRASQ